MREARYDPMVVQPRFRITSPNCEPARGDLISYPHRFETRDVLVRDLAERRKPRVGDDRLEPRAVMELAAVAIDQHSARVQRRETPELRVDEPEPVHHVLDVLVWAATLPDVLLDRIRARREDDHAIRLPAIADGEHAMELRVILGWILDDMCLERDARAFEQDHAIRIVVRRLD